MSGHTCQRYFPPIYLKSLPRQCLFVQPKLCSRVVLAHSYQNMKWILKVDPRIWISDTNCSENMRRNECLAYHWTKFISLIPRTHPCTNWCRFTRSGEKIQSSISHIMCVCVLLRHLSNRANSRDPLKFLWLKCMYNSSWGPSTHSNRRLLLLFPLLMEQNDSGLIFLSISILGKIKRTCAKFCLGPLKLKQLKFRSKNRGPGSNESRFPQPSTWTNTWEGPSVTLTLGRLLCSMAIKHHLLSYIVLPQFRKHSEHLMLPANQHWRQGRLISTIIYHMKLPRLRNVTCSWLQAMSKENICFPKGSRKLDVLLISSPAPWSVVYWKKKIKKPNFGKSAITSKKRPKNH